MPTTVSSFFNKAEFNGKRVAALLNGKALYYHDNNTLDPVPPSVFVWSHAKAHALGAHKDVITSYGKDWTHTYTKKARPNVVGHAQANAEYDSATRVTGLDTAHWSAYALTGLGAKPTFTGLYDGEADYGVSRARRVYLLAAFATLKKHGLKTKASSDGHNIGSILTSDSGEVLSWGVNSGGFCHAEVNTILGYLARTGATRLPARSVLFTTLKPCLMCSTLIAAVQDGGSQLRAWYAMMDTGEKGSSDLLGAYSAPFDTEKPVVNLPVADLVEDEPAPDTKPATTTTAAAAKKVTGTKQVNVGTGTGKENLGVKLDADEALRNQISAADWVDRSPEVLRLIRAAADKFSRKAGKTRADGPMKQALDHLSGWAI